VRCRGCADPGADTGSRACPAPPAHHPARPQRRVICLGGKHTSSARQKYVLPGLGGCGAARSSLVCAVGSSAGPGAFPSPLPPQRCGKASSLRCGLVGSRWSGHRCCQLQCTGFLQTVLPIIYSLWVFLIILCATSARAW